MGVTKNLIVRAGADFSAIARETKKTQQTLAAFKKNVSNTMKSIKFALAAVGIGKLIKDSTKVAMQNEASIQQINRSMNVHSKEFLQWANTQALGYGMAKSEATKYGAVYSNLVSGFARDTRETLTYTQDLLKASSIVASGTGRTMEDVLDRIRSGLLGNTEAIEDLGINVNIAMIESTEAFRKFANGKSWKQLSFQTQQQIRLMAILEQSSKKYGDSIIKNTASQQQLFIAQLKNIQLSLGQAFLPIYQIILPALNSLASKIAYVANIIAQFSQALFGKAENQAKATEQQANAVSSVGDAYTKAGKQAKKALAGFDELNTISRKGESGEGDLLEGVAGSGTGMSGTAGIDFSTNAPEISPKVKEMADKVKTAFGDMTKFIEENKVKIVSAIAGIGVAFGAFQVASNWTAIVTALKTALTALGAAIGGISLPALAIAAAIGAAVAAFIHFYKTNQKFKGFVDGVLNKIRDAAVYLWQNVLVPFAKFNVEVFKTSWEALGKAASWVYANVLKPLSAFFMVFWRNVLEPIAKVIGVDLAVAFDLLAYAAKSFWQNVLLPLGKALGEGLVAQAKMATAFLKLLWEKAVVPLAKEISEKLTPVFEDFGEKINWLLQNVLKPFSAWFSENFKKNIDSAFKSIGEAVTGLKTTFVGLMTFIEGVFTGDWKKAWEGVKGIFKGIFDSLYAAVKTPLNLIINSVNTLIKGLNKLNIKVPDWVPGLGGKDWGISIPQIPALAKGGLAYGPTMAMVGDNPNANIDPEVVSPLSGLKETLTQSVISAMKSMGGGGSGDVVINIAGSEFARIAIREINNAQRQAGKTLIEI